MTDTLFWIRSVCDADRRHKHWRRELSSKVTLEDAYSDYAVLQAGKQRIEELREVKPNEVETGAVMG